MSSGLRDREVEDRKQKLNSEDGSCTNQTCETYQVTRRRYDEESEEETLHGSSKTSIQKRLALSSISELK